MVTAAADQRSLKRLQILRLSTPIKPKLTTPNSWSRSRTRKSKSQVKRQPESVVSEQFFQDIVIAILVSGRIDWGMPATSLRWPATPTLRGLEALPVRGLGVGGGCANRNAGNSRSGSKRFFTRSPYSS